jgi:hypothetical protein
VRRRRFLAIVAAAAALPASGALAVWYASADSLPRRVAGTLRSVVQDPSRRLAQYYAYLNLDPAGLEAFVRDYERNYQRSLRFRPWREDVPLRYLLSTDHFRNRSDRPDVVRYVAFYDPYVTPCNNPLARFDA